MEEQVKFRFTNYINLSPKHYAENNYQAIYSSQLYGTFFIVYANFETEEDDDNYYIKNIKLKLINYKGILNLGITKAHFFKASENEKVVTEENEVLSFNGGYIQLTLKALANRSGNIKNVTGLDLKHPFSKKNSYINVFRTLEPMYTDASEMNGVFDNETYYRDGVKETENGEIITYAVPRKPNPNEEEFILKGEGSPRCPRAINRVL